MPWNDVGKLENLYGEVRDGDCLGRWMSPVREVYSCSIDVWDQARNSINFELFGLAKYITLGRVWELHDIRNKIKIYCTVVVPRKKTPPLWAGIYVTTYILKLLKPKLTQTGWILDHMRRSHHLELFLYSMDLELLENPVIASPECHKDSVWQQPLWHTL